MGKRQEKKSEERSDGVKLLDTPEMYLGSRGDDLKDTLAPMENQKSGAWKDCSEEPGSLLLFPQNTQIVYFRKTILSVKAEGRIPLFCIKQYTLHSNGFDILLYFG